MRFFLSSKRPLYVKLKDTSNMRTVQIQRLPYHQVQETIFLFLLHSEAYKYEKYIFFQIINIVLQLYSMYILYAYLPVVYQLVDMTANWGNPIECSDNNVHVYASICVSARHLPVAPPISFSILILESIFLDIRDKWSMTVVHTYVHSWCPAMNKSLVKFWEAIKNLGKKIRESSSRSMHDCREIMKLTDRFLWCPNCWALPRSWT